MGHIGLLAHQAYCAGPLAHQACHADPAQGLINFEFRNTSSEADFDNRFSHSDSDLVTVFEIRIDNNF
jgi:hypothetical protein